jgi:DNA polymerase III subunit delta
LKLTSDSLASHLSQQLLCVYLISGDEPLRVGEAADAIRARARQDGFSERETYTLERNPDWNAILGAASERSLFAERRILEIRLASGKPGVAGGAALTKLAQMRDAALLVLIIAPRLDRDAKEAPWVQAIDSVGAWIQIWPIDEEHLVEFLRARARRLGLAVEDEALEVLAARVEGNLLAAQQELEKLRLLFDKQSIRAADVLASVGDSARYDVAQLASAALAGEGARALHVLAGLRSEGAEPPLVLWALNKAVHDLWSAAASGAAAPPRWQRNSAALAHGLRRAHRVPFARITERALRADRVLKGRFYGDVWEEMALLTAEFCGAPLLPAPPLPERPR